MSKKEYLECLERLLKDLPAEERQAAMEYYTDYLEDAGPEGEAQAMEHLGSPEKVAADVRDGLKNDGQTGEWTETGYDSGNEEDIHPVPGRSHAGKKRRMGSERRLLLFLLFIFAVVCVGIPLLSAAGSVLLAVIAVIAVSGFGGFALALALFASGVTLLVFGIGKMAAAPAMGVMLTGGAFICFSLTGLALIAGAWMLRKVIPWMIQSAGALFGKISGVWRKRK